MVRDIGIGQKLNEMGPMLLHPSDGQIKPDVINGLRQARVSATLPDLADSLSSLFNPASGGQPQVAMKPQAPEQPAPGFDKNNFGFGG